MNCIQGGDGSYTYMTLSNAGIPPVAYHRDCTQWYIEEGLGLEQMADMSISYSCHLLICCTQEDTARE